MRPGLAPVSFIRDISTLKNLIDKERFDIVHTYRSPDYWRAALAITVSCRKPRHICSGTIVVSIHAHLFNRWIHNKATDLALATASVIVDNYHKAKGFDVSRVELMIDGVDTAMFHPSKRTDFLREKYAVPPGKFLVGTQARFAKIKGYDYLLPAIRS